MQIEQLKLILDTLSKMGEAGQDAFIWYMILDKALPMVTWLITFAAIIWLANRGLRAVLSACESDKFAKELRRLLLPETYGEMTPHERSRILKIVSTSIGK
jgi:hypothetical protein